MSNPPPVGSVPYPTLVHSFDNEPGLVHIHFRNIAIVVDLSLLTQDRTPLFYEVRSTLYQLNTEDRQTFVLQPYYTIDRNALDNAYARDLSQQIQGIANR